MGFWWRVSSGTNDDFSFWVGPSRKLLASGTRAWTWAGYDVPSGVVTLKWMYAKNASGVGGSDAAWVDEVALGL